MTVRRILHKIYKDDATANPPLIQLTGTKKTYVPIGNYYDVYVKIINQDGSATITATVKAWHYPQNPKMNRAEALPTYGVDNIALTPGSPIAANSHAYTKIDILNNYTNLEISVTPSAGSIDAELMVLGKINHL